MRMPETRLTLILTVLLVACPALRAAAMEDQIIAVVNEDVITMNDLRDFLDARILQLQMEGHTPDDIRAAMDDLQINGIKRLIEEKLILGAAEEMGLEVRPEAIDEKIAEIKTKYPSEQDFLDALLADGNTLTDLRDKVTDQLKIKYVIDEKIRSKISVNPQEVTDYYKSHFEEFLQPERLNLDSIFMTFTPDAATARARAAQAAAELAAGKDFSEVAKEYSASPSIGTVDRGQLLPAVEAEILKLNVDEVSPPIETDTGIYIFRLKGRSEAQVAGMNEVKDRIYNHLFNEKFRDRLQTWLEELRDKAFIEMKK